MPSDLDRAVAPPHWTLRVVDETGSTNADLAAAADSGAPEGLVLVAERQVAGRGRLDRVWSAPEGTGLTFSVLLRPPPTTLAELGWVPLLTGLAVAEAVTEATGVRARLKWPNDVIAEDRKLAGVLTERRPGGAVVVGVGLNVALAATDLPVPNATSLLLEGASTTDRSEVLTAVLAALSSRYDSWRSSRGDADACGLRPAYTVRCATVGREVQVQLGGGRVLEGQAVGVDENGRLLVNDLRDGTAHTVAAGDVVHVR